MHDSSELNPYLQQEVLSASRPRLRWLLLNKVDELTELISRLWLEEQYRVADQWVIRVRDILSELLSGVQDASNPVAKNIADFYVFLLQMLNELQQTRSKSRMRAFQELVRIEAETWRLVVEQQTSEAASHRPPIAPRLDYGSDGGVTSPHGGFSLEV